MSKKIIDYISGHEVLATSEEVNAVQVMARLLVEEYGYPKDCVQTHPQYRVRGTPSGKKSYPVDIAVFDSPKKDEDSIKIIVECKSPDINDGVGQLKQYLDFSRASLGIWFNGHKRVFLRKIQHEGKTVYLDLPNIPRYGERLEDIGRYRRRDLKAPHNLKVTFRAIRNYLAGNAVGATRDEVFAQQLIYLIFCKIYDERYTAQDDMVEFRSGIEEEANNVATRVEGLFDEVKSSYGDVLDESDAIELDDKTLAYIVGELQPYCLVEAERDVIAEAFETFIDPAFKGGQGQFFTPRNVVDLLVQLVDPAPEHLMIDPACGSGGFVVEYLRYIWRKLDDQASSLDWPEPEVIKKKIEVASRTIAGLDKDNFLTKIAKAYMTLIGDGRSGIFCEDSLLPPTEWSLSTQNHIELGKYDRLLTNPPFGQDIKITGNDKLKQYTLAHKWNKVGSTHIMQSKLKQSVRPEILFIERSVQMLKDKGIMAIVLPETFFHAPKSRYIMQFLAHHNITWIVDLPHNTFRPHNNAKCIAIILQKNTPQQPSINMAVAEQMGHDHLGKEMYRYDTVSERVSQTELWDDIPHIISEVEGGVDKKYTFSVPAETLAANNIYVPRYYWEAADEEITSIADSEGCDMVPMQKLLDEGLISCFDGHGSPKAEYKGKGMIPYIRVKDIVNWEIYKDPTARVPRHVYNDMVASKKQLLEGDVLFVRRGSYRIGSVAIASSYDRECILTREILVLRATDIAAEKSASTTGMNPYYLLYLLSHRLVQKQIFNKVLYETTLPNIGTRWMNLRLPIHRNHQDRIEIGAKVEEAIRAKWKARDLLAELMHEHGDLTT